MDNRKLYYIDLEQFAAAQRSACFSIYKTTAIGDNLGSAILKTPSPPLPEPIELDSIKNIEIPMQNKTIDYSHGFADCGRLIISKLKEATK